jgi:hypothetical protein
LADSRTLGPREVWRIRSKRRPCVAVRWRGALGPRIPAACTFHTHTDLYKLQKPPASARCLACSGLRPALPTMKYDTPTVLAATPWTLHNCTPACIASQQPHSEFEHVDTVDHHAHIHASCMRHVMSRAPLLDMHL